MRKKLNILIRKLLIISTLCLSINCFAEEQQFTKANEYTINYDNVSIIEYIQFISKLSNLNFIYNKDDLNFTVTIISKEPISKQSLISTLTQVLHIHDLYLIEDNSTIVISKIADVKELAPIIPPGQENVKNPIITSIFPIKNISVEALSTVIKPMISKNALLEILPNERQLIATDVLTNIKKIGELIESLDATENPLKIETYNIKANSSESLVSLTKQLMAPLITGNPYILVAQNTSRTIFIVSTPALVKKTLQVLENLDTPPQAELKTPQNLQIFIYKPINRTQKELQTSLQELAKNLEKENQQINIVEAIKNMNWIAETHSFVFSASDVTVTKLQQILQSFDTAKESKEKNATSPYSLLKLNYASGDKIEEEIESLANQFRQQKIDNPQLLYVMDNLKWVKETNSILLSGEKDSIDEVKTLIQQYDTPQKAKRTKVKNNFFIYIPKNASVDEIEDYINNTAKNLETSGLSDPDLLDTISTMKTVPSENSIIFTGSDETLEKIKNLLAQVDTPNQGLIKGNFLMYNPTNVTIEFITDSLNEIANNLKSSGLADPYLLEAIKSMKVTPSTNSIIFTGNQETLQKVQSLLNTIDLPTSKSIQKIGKINFWVYKIEKATPQQIITSIKSIAADLGKLDTSNKEFVKSLENFRYIKDTNSLVFTGTQETLEKIEPLVKKFDVTTEMAEAVHTGYYVYKPSYLPGTELEQILQHFAENIKANNLENPSLFQVIDSMKWSETTKTLVFTGEVQAIEEVKQLLTTFDVPNSNFPGTKEISGLEDLGFLVYKLQYHKGNEIQDALKQIATDLKSTQGEAATKFKLVRSIESIQLIEVTNSLLCSGDKETLLKLKELISNLDVPLKQVFIEVLIIQTTLTNALSFGLEWASKFQYKNQAVLGMSNSAPNSSGGTSSFINTMNTINNSATPTGNNLAFGSGFDLGVIGDILFHKGKSFLSLGSLLAALQNDAETSIIMTPKIIAQDGKTARIFSGSNIPYSGSVIQNASQNTLVTTNLEYRDVGLDLTITPILGNSDAVTLTINLESTVNPSSGTNITQLGQVTGITTLKTTMNTAVHIANKNFLVLSGMVRDEKVKSKTGIPCLGGLPVIGAAFSKNNTQQTKDNIVIFIRPHIVNTYEEMQHLTQTQEDFFREQQPTPALEREFDEATDLIKTYENE
jgi:type II secretory pathway component GspD/PulD (secretin)